MILVAPLSAEWAESASAILSERGYAAARLHSVSLVRFLMLSEGMAAIVADLGLLDSEAAISCIGALRRIHADLAVIVVRSADLEVKPALEQGATAFVAAASIAEELGQLFADLRQAPPG